MTDSPLLRLSRKQSPVTVLGPSSRAVLWVQGCRQVCPGCIAPESRPENGGELVVIADLAAWLRSCVEIEGVTVSGGEPFLQPEALLELIECSSDINLGWMAYSGYTFEWLQEMGTPAQRALLRRIDLLVDGPYLHERHADLLWRGSENQRLIAISDRYRPILDALARDPDADRSAGIEIVIDEQGMAVFTGVPAEPGFRDAFHRPDQS